MVAHQRFGVINVLPLVVKGVEYVFLSGIVIDVYETEILDVVVVFHHIPSENLENIVRGGQNTEILDGIPGVFEGIGHLQHFLQQGHEIFIQGEACGFVGFGHHLVAKVAEAVLPYAEIGLFL